MCAAGSGQFPDSRTRIRYAEGYLWLAARSLELNSGLGTGGHLERKLVALGSPENNSARDATYLGFDVN